MVKSISSQKLPIIFLRLILTLIVIVFSLIALRVGLNAYTEGILLSSHRLLLTVTLTASASLAGFLLLVGTWSGYQYAILNRFFHLYGKFKMLRRINLILVLTLNLLFAILVIGPASNLFQDVLLRIFSFALVILVGFGLVLACGFQPKPAELFLVSMLLSGSILQILSLITNISTYPFSMDWSEASRYYYASLYFSHQIYGFSVSPTVLHPSRYLMQAIPFLIHGTPLWFHRLWQVLLWIGTAMLTGWLVAKRTGVQDRLVRWLFIAWGFLYLFVGPVYYHLLVPIILILLGLFPSKNTIKWRTVSWFIILVSSAWAGISRVNWFPVPALVAITFYLSERPVNGRPWRYLILPVLWLVVGSVTALISNLLYIQWSGNPPEQFRSSFSSQLLWYRLLPNSTFPPGIILASLVVALPLLIFILKRLVGNWKVYHPVRLIGLAAILLALYVSGLVVSIKIGGGSNLHNLDAFWVLLLVMFGNICLGKFAQDNVESTQMKVLASKESVVSPTTFLSKAIFSWGMIVPLCFTLLSMNTMLVPDWTRTNKSLHKLQVIISQNITPGMDILFISNRQLITFGYIQGIRLIPEYERVFLMEMAMANNRDYMDKFHRDIKNQRFAMIINEPLYTTTKGSPVRFGEENDAWVKQVSEPLLCYYKLFQDARMLLMESEIQVLVPRQNITAGCP
jgi:hypothetical protein